MITDVHYYHILLGPLKDAQYPGSMLSFVTYDQDFVVSLLYYLEIERKKMLTKHDKRDKMKALV